MKKETRIRSTVEFLDLLCDHYKCLSQDEKTPATDYRVAKQLEVTTQSVSKWRTGKAGFDDTTAIRVADLLDMEREYVLACVHFERAKASNVRDTWRVIALGSTNALVLAVAGFAGLGGWGI